MKMNCIACVLLLTSMASNACPLDKYDVHGVDVYMSDYFLGIEMCRSAHRKYRLIPASLVPSSPTAVHSAWHRLNTSSSMAHLKRDSNY